MPGRYKFELYGASGGNRDGSLSAHIYPNKSCISEEIIASVNGNVKCVKAASRGGAGGYISGIISIQEPIKAFATIGGKGEWGWKNKSRNTKNDFLPENMERGGYGGGGSASNFWYDTAISAGTAAGGGQTALKLIENDLWHRVIVSGAGGGADNPYGTIFAEDDGSGGSGGDLIAQAYWIEGVYQNANVANSTFGFTFGSGESAYSKSSVDFFGDKCGAGGGWFGGFASKSTNGGCGGGSSWALTNDAIIPEDYIEAKNEFSEFIGRKKYAFSKRSDFIF